MGRGQNEWRGDRCNKGLHHQYSESVSDTSEVEDICFTLKSAMGLSHDETQPGAPQYSKICHWSLLLLLPHQPTRSQHTPRRRYTNPAIRPPPALHTLVAPSCRYVAFTQFVVSASEHLYVIGHSCCTLFFPGGLSLCTSHLTQLNLSDDTSSIL